MDAELARRIEGVLTSRVGTPIRVDRLEALPGGACQEMFRADLVIGETPQRMVLRSDARAALPGSIDRKQEHAAIEAALAAGVKTPAVRWLTDDLVRPGAAAYFMDWVEGDTIGRRVLKAPELAEARKGLASQLAAELAKIHSVTPGVAPSLFGGAPPSDHDPASARLALARGTIERLPEPRPAIELAMRWLEAHRPPRREVTLVHGDFRTGNFAVTPSGLSAVLDWEFAHWGTPAEDLSWLSLRDWRFGALDKPMGGLASRAEVIEPYQAATGRTIDPRDVLWWSVAQNVWWAAGCVLQGERYTSGESKDIELIAIARRAAEMEYEALRLIGRAR